MCSFPSTQLNVGSTVISAQHEAGLSLQVRLVILHLRRKKTMLKFYVPGILSINAIISAITDALVSPEMLTRILTGSEIGLPETLDQNGQFMFDKKLNNEG